MKNKIIELKEFAYPDSEVSGIFIINKYWLEHLLNLFYQGYIGKVWEEIMETSTTFHRNIKNCGYGVINDVLDEELEKDFCSQDIKLK